MKFDKGTPPFARGDRLRMLEDGFSIAKGCIVTAGPVKWVTGHEWCVEVHIKNHYGRPIGYRANRFEKVMENEMENNLYAIMEVDLNGNPTDDTITWTRGTYKEAEEVVRRTLVHFPDKRFVFGRMDKMAYVDLPPIKFSNI